MTKEELIKYLTDNDDIVSISLKQSCKIKDGQKIIKLESITVNL